MIDENSTFGGFLTAIGEAKQANANALEIPWKLTHMLLGDANGTDPVPEHDQTQLINQRHRAAINQLSVDPANPAILIAEIVLPPNIGGWWIRELALEDEDGDFVAVANCPPSYKPLLAQGSGRNQVVRMHVVLSNTANVQLKIDPSVVLATRQYADNAIATHAGSRNHPAASTAAQGMVRMATSEETRQGTRTDRATHPAGIKSAIEEALSNGGYQFAAYDEERTYTTGEIVRSDGVFYEFYDRDQDGTVQGVDPTNSANRPHIWMQWDGVKPGTTVEWRSETLPEGYVENDGSEISRTDYRRIFAAFGTTYGAGNGSTTFAMPDDRGEFKRGLDRGRGVDPGRSISAHQMDQFQGHRFGTGSAGSTGSTMVNGLAEAGNENRSVVRVTGSGTALGIQSDGTNGTPRVGNQTRSRNNAVIYLTKA
ncbi:phage tail protein [Billgrantia ethanolica]|uniref:Phage tail protein n=1 Tax=Billgrantia ethanolica TaxID=2733486 RepID=A0ABS9A131_9GAMM|nr:phage tail protein [Halomonas ethanolica]MCE8002537.1 hypothetical protein [Halomonas ethanolica]